MNKVPYENSPHYGERDFKNDCFMRKRSRRNK